MARTARAKSESEIYHVMLRGINRQQIFLDEEDNQRFLDVLIKCREISEFQMFAYCLMGNHVHLLLKAEREPLAQVMKRIETRYVVWYNSKYERVGHLFQDRYKSEAVQDDAYFLTVLRYILNNPVKAGICSKSTEYLWSSARDYFSDVGISDTAFAEAIVGRDVLQQYLSALSEEACMDDTPARLSDRAALELLPELVEASNNQASIQAISQHPDHYIPMLRSAGLSIRQICRITGLSFGTVRKY